MKCPCCGGEMRVVKLRCDSCGATVEGKWRGELFLEGEFAEFVKLFVYFEGNLKSVERSLGWSYPKVKNFLKKLKAHLGMGAEEEGKEGFEGKEERMEVLERISRGEISVEEALKELGQK